MKAADEDEAEKGRARAKKSYENKKAKMAAAFLDRL